MTYVSISQPQASSIQPEKSVLLDKLHTLWSGKAAFFLVYMTHSSEDFTCFTNIHLQFSQHLQELNSVKDYYSTGDLGARVIWKMYFPGVMMKLMECFCCTYSRLSINKYHLTLDSQPELNSHSSTSPPSLLPLSQPSFLPPFLPYLSFLFLIFTLQYLILFVRGLIL